jgi:hypothetical protein
MLRPSSSASLQDFRLAGFSHGEEPKFRASASTEQTGRWEGFGHELGGDFPRTEKGAGTLHLDLIPHQKELSTRATQ